MSFEIRVRKEGNSNIFIRIPSKKLVTELKPEQTLNFDGIAYGFWDGEKFQLISRGILGSNVKIISKDITIALVSYKSINCEVYSPVLEIGGITVIDCLTVRCDESHEKNFIINGGLITKYLDINCSLEINGEIYFKEQGTLINDSIGVYEMVVNGRLSFEKELKIKNGTCTNVNIINNGLIISEEEKEDKEEEEQKQREKEQQEELSGILYCSSSEYRNEVNGIIKVKEGHFNIERKFENYGKLLFKNFSITGRRGLYDFQQNGLCHVEETATLHCGINSTGETLIHHLVLPRKSGSFIKNIKVIQGNTLIDRITGSISSIDSINGATIEIGEINGDTEFAKCSGNNGKLILNKLKSEKKITLSSNSGGSTILNEGDVPESFIYSDNGLLDISNVKGKSTAFVNGSANLKVNTAEKLSLFAEDEAIADISQSVLEDAYFKNRNNTISKSKVEKIYNRGKLDAVDIQANRINNNGNIEFRNKTSSNKIVNDGELTFRDGDHQIKNLCLSNTKVKVRGNAIENEEEEEGRRLLLHERNESINPSVKTLLRDGKAKVSVENIIGGGSIESKNQLYKHLPTNLEITGNTFVQTDRMPDPNEIPIHKGLLSVNVDMKKDYVNDRNTNYDNDTVFQLNCHNKYKFVNKSNFSTGGLIVNESTEFLNKDGTINLEKGLCVKSKHFKSEATPITRENGRRVDISVCGNHLSCYCPAKYYSRNKKTGIYVFDGDIYIESDNNIENIFDNIYTSGSIHAYAKENFVNTVGNIRADGYEKSTIKAKEIKNECLPPVLRQGEIHASGSSGGWFNRSSWSIHYRIREWITQSHGSTMSFGSDVDLDGHTTNTGSLIKSYGTTRGNINNKSLFENTATVDSGSMAIEGSNINIENARIIVRDKIFNSKAIEDIN